MEDSDQNVTLANSNSFARWLCSPAVWLPFAVAGGVAAAWRLQRPMVDQTERVHIRAHPEAVWTYISDFENHWEPSNPEHNGTRVLDDPKEPLRDGLRFTQTEDVGGITGTLQAVVHDVLPERKFSWTAEATYRLVGLSVTVKEGGMIELTPTAEGTALSHRVWSQFPQSLAGTIGGLFLVAFGEIESDAAEHTRVELEYFKRQIEKQSTKR
jgi:hypothetical protein